MKLFLKYLQLKRLSTVDVNFSQGKITMFSPPKEILLSLRQNLGLIMSNGDSSLNTTLTAKLFSDSSSHKGFWSGDSAMHLTWEEGIENLANQQLDYFVTPWNQIPFERESEFIIAALSPRIDHQYYLLDERGVKHILAYQAEEVLFCGDENAARYVQEFNRKPQIVFTKKDQISATIELLPIEGLNKKETPDQNKITALATNEFIPPVAHGILAAVCMREDLDARRFLLTYHDALSKDMGNIERGLERFFREDPKQFISAHVNMDNHGNYHGSMALQRANHIHYIIYSQSTIVDFVENFTDKI